MNDIAQADTVPVSEILDHPVLGERAWSRDEVDTSNWRIELTDSMVAELISVVTQLRSAPLPLLLCRARDFLLVECRTVVQQVRNKLHHGMGLAIVSGLPMNVLSKQEAVTIFWLIGQMLSNPVATKWDGTMLYDVIDTEKEIGYGVRAAETNAELFFHTDNAFGLSVPDYVGLLCIYPAARGGISRFCSMYSVHNELLKLSPKLLRRLYEPVYYDRQEEHCRGASKTLTAPVFHFSRQQLTVRLSFKLIRRGYALAGQRLDALLVEALECLEHILRRDEMSIEYRIERGEMQFVNNHWTAHARSAFEDEVNPKYRRHLVRSWYREQGRPTYDG
ncbi:TauD/TfdA family dioxygenase [Variovorax terrae]|uniref:TauD/TfdA family dioxygenase n=1 Tax=Variovorax terrae TaxID=2923278 RepID=A0A9X2AP53_9BURK|nr:TauD/TfdA family dioxygenase [Variovorax terrae]MCJ0764495.1 TauD/TfdA family dioxygenase [Variovorax terrae]